MSTNNPQFRLVMRGFDPVQVNTTLAELTAALEAARREVADRTALLTTAQAEHAELTHRVEASLSRISELEQAQLGAAAPSYEDLGERIGTMLHLADAEAQAIRQSAQADAALVVEEASRSAAVRREEAEALYETQRDHAASAAADFETTLAARRDQAAQEFSAQLKTHEESLRRIQIRAAALQQETDAAHAEAKKAVAQTIETAQAEAIQHVEEAREIAVQIRHEAERELTATTQHRDRITAQLANVRQMLATLGDAAMAQLASDGADGADGIDRAGTDQAGTPTEGAATPGRNGAAQLRKR